MSESRPSFILTGRVLRVLRRIGWASREMERQALRPLAPAEDVWPEWDGWFCLASGCVEDRRDSHGECINCGEPVVRVAEA